MNLVNTVRTPILIKNITHDMCNKKDHDMEWLYLSIKPYVSEKDYDKVRNQSIDELYNDVINGKITIDIDGFNPNLVFKEYDWLNHGVKYIIGKDKAITIADVTYIEIEFYDNGSIVFDEDYHLSKFNNKHYLVVFDAIDQYNSFGRVAMEFENSTMDEIINKVADYIVHDIYHAE